MVRDFTDAEYYFGGMEPIESNIMKKTFSAVSEMDLRSYRGSDVENALAKERLDIDDFASLLSPAAEAYLEEMALRARDEKFRYFGNSVSIFTPLYVSNYC